MNVNVALKCDICKKTTHCRIGLSGGHEQLYRFACQGCHSPIDINFSYKKDFFDSKTNYTGAVLEKGMEMDSCDYFINLHLDFPTFVGPYVMGETPFIMASTLLGHEKMLEYIKMLGLIDTRKSEEKEIKTAIRLYISEKYDIFKNFIHEYFDKMQFPCVQMIDVNKALYQFIELSFMGLNRAKEVNDYVNDQTKRMCRIEEMQFGALKDFINELVETKYLYNCQKDVLEVYPRILDASSILRIAVFFDYTSTKLKMDGDHPTVVTGIGFAEYKDLYKDMSEIISRNLVIIAGLQNIEARGNHNIFPQEVKPTITSISEYAKISLGNKLKYIDNPEWANQYRHIFDSKLRNAIAHCKIEYNEVTQEIKYYPKIEGMLKEESETIKLLEFSIKLLETFRFLHMNSHLIKILWVFYYAKIRDKKTVA